MKFPVFHGWAVFLFSISASSWRPPDASGEQLSLVELSEHAAFHKTRAKGNLSNVSARADNDTAAFAVLSSLHQNIKNATELTLSDGTVVNASQTKKATPPPPPAAAEYCVSNSAVIKGLLNAVLLWLPLIVAAAALTFVDWENSGSVQRSKFGNTSAITGLRAFLAVLVVLEHAGFHQVPLGGTFILLSGLVISLSRRHSPGVCSSPIDSVPSYAKFVFLRAARVLPLYWAMQVMLPDMGWVERDIFEDTGGLMAFYYQLPNRFLNLVTDPRIMWLCCSPQELAHCWFVQTILVLYLTYPIMERIVLGPANSQPPHPSRLYMCFGIGCMAKLACFGTFLHMQNEGQLHHGVWLVWKGWTLYANPLLHVPDFMFGIVVPHLADGGSSRTWIPAFTDFLLCFMVILAFVCPQSPASLLFCNLNVEAPLIALVMWGLCFGSHLSPLGHFFIKPFVVRVGEWAYGIYLFHLFVLFLTSSMQYSDLPNPQWAGELRLNMKCWKAVCMVIPTTALLAWPMYVLVEKPTAKGARAITEWISARISDDVVLCPTWLHVWQGGPFRLSRTSHSSMNGT